MRFSSQITNSRGQNFRLSGPRLGTGVANHRDTGSRLTNWRNLKVKEVDILPPLLSGTYVGTSEGWFFRFV